MDFFVNNLASDKEVELDALQAFSSFLMDLWKKSRFKIFLFNCLIDIHLREYVLLSHLDQSKLIPLKQQFFHKDFILDENYNLEIEEMQGNLILIEDFIKRNSWENFITPRFYERHFDCRQYILHKFLMISKGNGANSMIKKNIKAASSEVDIIGKKEACNYTKTAIKICPYCGRKNTIECSYATKVCYCSYCGQKI